MHKERARRQYGDRCGRSRFRRAQRDGCDPAAIPNTEHAEVTQGKPLKNTLIGAFGDEISQLRQPMRGFLVGGWQ
ncbi:hypothetical protein [Candidatus Glomeribacter gigasporarum]|uniref:hypothetical protein n=1 Tax=Candidatus Glomeribacter gigasporarum TaxID=132144 RepID=UPI001EF0B13D|nr:hypothetical protein [Candidatus Glomeribacter gigasporarum]